MSDNFIGEVRAFAPYAIPDGWAACDGSLLSIGDHTALFGVIGNAYGGDGTRTFAVPNMTGSAPLHVGGHQPGPGLSPYQLGQASGVETVTLTIDQLPTHTHAPVASSAVGTLETPGTTIQLAAATKGNPVDGQTQGRTYSLGEANAPMAGSLGVSGAGGAHANMMPSLVVTFAIALTGTLPPHH